MISRCIQQTCGFLDGWFLCKGPGGEICLWRSALCGGSSRLVVAHWAEPRSRTPSRSSTAGSARPPSTAPPAHLMQQAAAAAAQAVPAAWPPAPAGLEPDRAAVILVPWCFAICSSSEPGSVMTSSDMMCSKHWGCLPPGWPHTHRPPPCTPWLQPSWSPPSPPLCQPPQPKSVFQLVGDRDPTLLRVLCDGRKPRS